MGTTTNEQGGESAGTPASAKSLAYHGDAVSRRVIRCMLTVHHTLGPGFLESVYRRALLIELGIEGLNAESEKGLTIRYNGVVVGLHRLDVLVEGCVIVELKAVEAIHRAHYDQLRSYLRAAGLRTGLLANFSGHKVDFRRVDMEIRRLPDDG